MRNLVLTGMMGSGKSTCGRRLAQLLGREFMDTDEEIALRDGRTIPRIFAEEGEAFFRDLESRVALELSARSDLVIATGGGLILRPENRKALRKNGFVVFLNRPAAEIFSGTSMAGRPLAQDGMDAFLRTFAEREPLYRSSADYVATNFCSPEDTVREILDTIQGWEEDKA